MLQRPRLSRPVWFVNLIKKSYPLRFRAARLTRLPVLETLVERSVFHGDDSVYLPSDRSIRINENLPQPESTVLPSALVDHFIRRAAYHWIMDFCLCREGNHCAEYPRHYGCIFLGQAVLDINPRLGRLVTADEALEHARRCREAGLVQLIGRNKLDVMWLGAGPGGRLLTICNCCPCCCLWKVLPEMSPRISAKVSRLPGVSVSVSQDCAGCGLCAEGACFVDAISLVDGRAQIGAECRGCGRCVEVCPNGAITLSYPGNGTVESAIRRLSQAVDVG